MNLRLRLLPFLLRHLLRLVHEDERAFLVADDEVGAAVTVHVGEADLAAHAGVVVNEPRHPVHGLVRVAHELEPVSHGGVVAAGVGAGAVRPEAFAGDEVLQPVAVQVHQLDRVELREGDAEAVLARLLVHEDVGAELGAAGGVLGLELLIPSEAVAVRRERGDDVVQPVAVHIVGEHLRAARGEEGFVKLPHRVANERRGLLEPAAATEQVHAPIPIHIPDAQAVGELAPLAILADGREDPLGGDVLPVGFGVAEVALVVADNLRLPVAIKVRERRRLVVHLVEDLMPRPVLLLALRIEVKKCGRAGQAVGEHVIPAIAVEVVDEREEVVPRVGILAAHRALEAGELHIRAVLLRLGRARGGINLVALREGRPFPPVRPGDGVGLPVLVEVAEDGALGPVVLVELLLLERGEQEISCGGGHGDGESGEEQGKRLHARGCRKQRGGGSRGLAGEEPGVDSPKSRADSLAVKHSPNETAFHAALLRGRESVAA